MLMDPGAGSTGVCACTKETLKKNSVIVKNKIIFFIWLIPVLIHLFTFQVELPHRAFCNNFEL